MSSHVDRVFGYPSIVRFSWSTAKDIIQKECVDVDWYVPSVQSNGDGY